MTPETPHDCDGRSDRAAIEAVLAGDTQRFAELVNRYQRSLYRYAVAMVLDHDAAADMVQDAFVRTYTHLRECRDGTRFRAWVFQTLRHRCLDHLKEAARRNVRLDEVGPIVDPAASPPTIVERERLHADINRALAELPPAQREAFVLRHVEGVSYEEMAGLFDVSVSALKMRVLRAREALAAAVPRVDVTEPAAARLVSRRG
jgi:RNA polymerase sigma-70 factor (ECF subfamily)